MTIMRSALSLAKSPYAFVIRLCCYPGPDRYTLSTILACVSILSLTACTPIELLSDRSFDIIRVNAEMHLKDVSHHPIGINVNYLMDDDDLLQPATGIADALKAMGTRYLRYPGGEKSDSYLWTSAPWPTSLDSNLSPRVARTGSGEWPADSAFTLPDMATLVPETLDFEEFMSICAMLLCEPVIVVALDSAYGTPAEFGDTPTSEELLQSAVEWVRYANITRRYGIKYWMVGNESYLTNDGEKVTAKKYTDDLVEFSKAMKAIDPSIKIIANGHTDRWWSIVLTEAAEHIDYLGVSNYPVYEWRNYDTYRRANVILDDPVRIAVAAIEKYSSPADSDRLQVIVTETNTINFSARGWSNKNDLGHALVLFQIFGDLLMQPKVFFIQAWGTRWIDVGESSVPRIFDTIDEDGGLRASGLVIATWGNYLLDTMVSTTGTNLVKAYASVCAATGQLNVFLINKDRRARNARIEITGHGSEAEAVMRSLSGNGPDDTEPRWQVSNVRLSDQRTDLILEPVSITVIEFLSRSETQNSRRCYASH